MAKTTPAGWRCERCGRRFRQRTREHSCEVRTIDAHLVRGSPAIQQTFAALRDALETIGPHAVVPVKTMILLRSAANFGGIVIRRDALHLEFMYPRSLDSPRIHKSDRFSNNRYTHHTRLSSPADVDAELTVWLRQSYLTSVRAR